MKNSTKKIINYLGTFIVLICIAFLIKNIMKADIQWNKYLTQKYVALVFAICIVISIIFIYITASTYGIILTSVSNKIIPKQVINKIYLTSNIAKYLPGNVMHFVGRNLLSLQYDIPQKKIVLSTILELLMIGISCLLWLVLSGRNYLQYALNKIFSVKSKIYIYSGILIILVVIGLIVIILKKKSLANVIKEINIKLLLRAQIRHIIIFSISPLTYCLLLYAILPKFDSEIFLLAFSAYMIAWIVGFVTPGAPGGIGIKELILSYFLDNVLGNEIVLVSIIIHRVLLVISDLIAYLIFRICSQIKDKK